MEHQGDKQLLLPVLSAASIIPPAQQPVGTTPAGSKGMLGILVTL